MKLRPMSATYSPCHATRHTVVYDWTGIFAKTA